MNVNNIDHATEILVRDFTRQHHRLTWSIQY